MAEVKDLEAGELRAISDDLDSVMPKREAGQLTPIDGKNFDRICWLALRVAKMVLGKLILEAKTRGGSK